jgi:hypothetical protein
MLFIILIEQLFIPENKNELDEIAGGFSTGFLLFALFFMKLTYFCAGVLIILFRMLMIDYSRKWLFSVIVGALTITIPIFIYMKCDILPMFNDYRMISRVRGALLLNTETIMSSIAPHWKAFLLLLVSWILVPPFTVVNGRKTITKNTMSAALVILLLSAAFLNLTNCGPDDIPLMALISFIPLQFYKQSEKAVNGKAYWIQAALIVLFFLINWSYFIKNTGSIFYASSWKAKIVNRLQLCNTPTLSDYYVSYYDGYGNSNYIEKVNEGLDLLRRNMDKEDRIVTLNFEDPFTIGLLLKSPRGDSITYHYTMNFNLEIYWDPDKLFSEATMVMVPKDDDPFAANPLRAVYSKYLISHYDLKAESKRWLLLKRKRRDSLNVK